MALHMIIEQADMRTGAHATGSLFIATMIPYPIFLYHLTKRMLIHCSALQVSLLPIKCPKPQLTMLYFRLQWNIAAIESLETNAGLAGCIFCLASLPS